MNLDGSHKCLEIAGSHSFRVLQFSAEGLQIAGTFLFSLIWVKVERSEMLNSCLMAKTSMISQLWELVLLIKLN